MAAKKQVGFENVHDDYQWLMKETSNVICTPFGVQSGMDFRHSLYKSAS